MPRPLSLILCSCWLFAAWAGSASAQTAAPSQPATKPAERTADEKPASAASPGPVPPGQAAPGAAADSARPEASEKYEILYLPKANGELVPVPAGGTLEGYLEWLQKRANLSVAYSVTNIELEGTSDDERVLLMARIQVKVTRADEWVRVPLQMGEAVLRDSSYRGPGEAMADRRDPDAGYFWFFRGAGEHELVLTISVPLAKLLPARRFQLSLPPTAQSSLKLEVPHARVQTKVVQRSTIATRPGKQGTEIEVFGLGQLLDLTWQPIPEASTAETVLEVSTAIGASLVDAESVTLEANQRIQALQGSFDELRVQLPPGFELLRVDGSEYQEHRIDTEGLNKVVVRLKKPTAGPVELKWTVRSKLVKSGTTIALEGFEVDRARIQTGFVAVGVVGDFRVTNQPESDRFVQRVNMADLPTALRQTQVAAGYRFLNQPFRLMLNLRKVEPFVSVESGLFLHFAAEQVDLDAVFQFQVYRGSVSELQISWPGWQQANWVLDSVEPPGRVEQTASDADGLRIRLAEPVKEAFEIRLKARRAIPKDQASFGMSFPAANVASRSPTTIVASLADNLELGLRGLENTQLRQLPAGTPVKVNVPREYQRYRRSLYRLDSVQSACEATLAFHKQELKSNTDIKAALDSARLAIEQRIHYQVDYERLSQIRLVVPAELGAGVTFTSASGTELVPNWIKTPADGAREALLTLEQPRLGAVEIDVRYNLTPAVQRGADPSVTLVPLVTSADAAFGKTRFEWRDTGNVEVGLLDEGWTRQPSGSVLAWTRGGEISSLQLQMSHNENSTLRGVLISRALIRTVIDADGLPHSRATYYVNTPFDGLHVNFPSGVTPTAFWWGRQRLSPAKLVDDAGKLRYEIRVPDSGISDAHLLAIEFQESHPANLEFSSVQNLSAPEFPDDVWVTETVWEVVTPANQHLFSLPPGYLPDYQWMRGPVFWSRHPNRTTEQLWRWMSTDELLDESLLTDGNRYVFSCFGPARHMQFRLMNQAGLVLLGAGLSLVFGLMLVKVPATRHVLTLLTLGFLVAAVGLWYPTPVLILLQPAILGVSLATAAAALDGWAKRRRQRGVVTLTSPSGFMTAAPSSQREAIVGVGSEEFTSIRPNFATTTEVGPPAESGSRA